MSEQKITPAMRKWIGRANSRDQIVYRGPRGLGHAAWERCMKRAELLGLVTPNAYGEFELTAAGKAVRKSTPL